MSAKSKAEVVDPIAKLREAGFEVNASSESAGWMQATRNGCAIMFRQRADHGVETSRSAGLLRHGRIFRVLDKGFQKFLTDDRQEVPALASDLNRINFFDQGFKEAIGLPVKFNEALGALTALTNLDRVERPILAGAEKPSKSQSPESK
jgi:hypothetical protein